MYLKMSHAKGFVQISESFCLDNRRYKNLNPDAKAGLHLNEKEI